MITSFLQDNLRYVTVVVILICTIWIFTRRKRSKDHLRLPPGPPGWPVIGSTPILFRDPGATNDDYFYTKCSRRYGDIYKLKLGPQLMYVLNNPDHVREVFTHRKAQSRVFAVAYTKAFGPTGRGIVTASGPEWTMIKRFTQDLFRDVGVGRGLFADKIQLEINRFVEKLGSLPEEPCWNFRELFYSAISNLSCGITFGHQYDYEDVELKQVINIMESYTNAIGPSAIVLTNKVLCDLPFGPGKKVMDSLTQFKNFLGVRIQESKVMPNSDESSNNFVKAFLVEMEKGETFFDDGNLIACCLELFFAGTDTTASYLSWAILFLTTHPSVQAKCQRELDDFVNEHGTLCYSDQFKLPYMQAMLLETGRVASVAPLGVPHMVDEDLQLLGYDFPKGTLVVGNFTNINMSEERFPEPREFRPERFIKNGHFETNADVMIFSVGRRACLGKPLAKMEIFLFLVALLREFTFTSPVNIEMPDFREAVNGGTRRPLPFAVVVKRRGK